MLPILRILPVGGVLLAIAVLMLALTPPDGTRASHPPRALASARGALIDRGEHPEWRQFLILAALRRAEEIKRLLDLTDTPTHTEPAAPPETTTKDDNKVAAVPTESGNAGDVTGSINEAPHATIPVEIGETSSTELPVTQPEETPPVTIMPERAVPTLESTVLPPQRPQRAKARPRAKAKPKPKEQTAAQFNLLEALFGHPQSGPATAGKTPAAQPARSTQ